MLKFLDKWYRVLLARPIPERLRTVLLGMAMLVQELRRDQVQERAAGLSYWTIVAIVPVLILAAVIMRAMGLEATPIRELLIRTLRAGEVAEVGRTIDQWIEALDFGGLGALGLFGVLWTGSRIFFQAEQAYNHLWRSEIRRGLVGRLLLFYAGVTLTPLLLSWSFHLTESLPVDPSFTARLQPTLLSTGLFVGAIRLLPDRHVKWGPALGGGLASGFLFETAKAGFGSYLRLLGTEESSTRLYGSLGLLPIFLLWVNLVWLIVLSGAKLAFVLQNRRLLHVQEERRLRGETPLQPDAFFALKLFHEIGRQFLDKKGPTTTGALSVEIRVEPDEILPVLEGLAQVGLLQQVGDGWVPNVPPDRITVGEVIRRYRGLLHPGVEEDALLEELRGGEVMQRMVCPP